MFNLFKRHIPRVSDDHRTRARAGARLLDKRAPGWVDRIDSRRLNIHSYHNCALGQTYGSFGIGMAVLNLDAVTATKYGFADIDDEYAALTEAWKVEVYDRKRKVVV